MPSDAAIARSRGVVMKRRTRSALAPTYAVRTVIVALSIRGYWRTFSVRIAWIPAMMMMRLTTIARTGRRMKTSVSFTAQPSPILGVRRKLGLRLNRVTFRDRRAIVKLEGTGRNDLLPRDEPVEHRDEIAAGFSKLDELLASDLGG